MFVAHKWLAVLLVALYVSICANGIPVVPGQKVQGQCLQKDAQFKSKASGHDDAQLLLLVVPDRSAVHPLCMTRQIQAYGVLIMHLAAIKGA
jgi:hypothetical protein